ncbi:response regulator transcription factor [Oceanispirochaeta crateris]|uniref:Response regulator transcription factor n=1 Tax=Oceanispirochaeta crateris TaxID=2518645 RepID=A0A5C1QL26_9SPIO|nr:response regulator transcription factor [Oceanispirochaeta crateris]QEN08177.1 response regulator transcription factor [Oceanispirochaeta crateris]
MANTILIVDDEHRIRKLVSDFLKKDGFLVLEAQDGQSALEIFRREKSIDLIILDVMMPVLDGWAVCREIRKESDVPIFMLTARGEESNELLGFEMGVDEYIKKPFSPKILVARVNSILKRLKKDDVGSEKFGILEVNRKGRFFVLEGERLELSPKEYELLLLLIDNRDQALSRDQILNSVWDFNYYKGMRTVDTHVKKLRKKLGKCAHYIQTVRNFGYRFEVIS